MNDLSAAGAAALDAADPLAGFRDRFVVADPDTVYLDGNSLGRLPRETLARLQDVVAREWGGGLVGSWERWLDLPGRAGDLVGSLVGAAPGQVVIADSTTVNFYKLAAAALDARPGRRAIVTDPGNFPTDRYVLEGLCAARGLELRWTTPDRLDSALDTGVALVTFSLVDYRSAEILDLAAITAAAHDAGALVLWDLSHAAGAVPVALDASGADLAVGCTYKYLNAGPGAPAFLYVRRELQAQLRQPIWGWFGQREQFAMGPAYDPQPDIRRFLVGTSPVLGIHAVEVGAALLAEAGIDALRAKSIAQTEYLIALHDAWLAPLGFTLGSPRDPARRGSHVSLRHPDAARIALALRAHANVVPDFRAPDVIRCGIAPIYTRYADVWEGMDRLRRLVESGVHTRVDPASRRVT